MRFGSRPYQVTWYVCFLGPAVVLSSVQPPWWVWVAVYAPMTVAFAVFLLLFGRRHRRALAQWAARAGWQVGEPTPELTAVGARAPFAQGTRRTVSDVLRAPAGPGHPWEITSFTYRWSTPSRGRNGRRSGGDNNGSYAHVVVVRLPVALPWLEVTPETAADRAARTVGGQDIDLESAAFNAAFRVRSDDARFAHDVLHPRLLQDLLDLAASDPERRLGWRIEGDALIWWRSGVTDVAAIAPAARTLVTVASRIPAYVWQDRAVSRG